jgi:hypothetical protein
MAQVWRTVRLILIALCLLAAVAAELAYTLSRFLLQPHNTESAQRAAWITPGDEAAYLQLADLNSGLRRRYLAVAVKRNPWDAQAWMNLGFLAEMDGDVTEGERDFRMAAEVDRRAAPAWALANFYFQHSDMDGFDAWAARYRQYANGNVAGLYRMAWRRQPQVADLIKHFSPMTCSELEELDSFLEPHATSAEMVPVDTLLVSCQEQEAVRLVTADISRLLMEDHPNLALDLWNRLDQNRYFDFKRLGSRDHNLLANSDFNQQLDEAGFDWRVNRTPGVHTRRLNGSGHSLEFALDGSEPEAATLLFQPVALAGGTTYRLEAALGAGEGQDEAFGWRLVELSTGRTLANGVRDTSTEHKDVTAWILQAPPSSRTLALAFTYIRPAGHIREEGKVTLSQVRLFPGGFPASK